MPTLTETIRMCTPQDLLTAADKLKNAGESRRVRAIAKDMRKRKATPNDIEWAKRITMPLRNRHR